MEPAISEATRALRQSNHVTAPLCLPSVFTPAECDAILAMGEGRFTYETGQTHPIEDYRLALTHWIVPGRERSFIDERLAFVVEKVNRRYRFEITGFSQYILLSQYQVGDGFEWHMDAAGTDTSTRKLSLSVQLTNPGEYEGGGLEFMPHGEIAFSRDQGTIIVFPSYLCHRVARVTRGARAALVGWAEGPTFK